MTLDPDALAGWAEENGVSGDYTEIVASEKCKEMVSGYVDELNNQLNRWETRSRSSSCSTTTSPSSPASSPRR